MVTKIGKRRKVEKKPRKQPSWTFAELDHEPHKNQLKNKMVKNKTNNKNKTNDVNVVNKGRENTKGKNPHITP